LSLISKKYFLCCEIRRPADDDVCGTLHILSAECCRCWRENKNIEKKVLQKRVLKKNVFVKNKRKIARNGKRCAEKKKNVKKTRITKRSKER